jgi:hypothetical protein
VIACPSWAKVSFIPSGRLSVPTATFHLPLSGVLAHAVAWLCLFARVSMAHADVFDEGDRVMVEVAPYVYHYVDNTDHNQWPRLIGVEYETGSHWLGGAAFFRNSYYQNAAYAYVGKRWFIDAVAENLYVKLTAGMVYGYKDPYEDKVQLNNNGYGLGIVPAVGYQFGRAKPEQAFVATNHESPMTGHRLA